MSTCITFIAWPNQKKIPNFHLLLLLLWASMNGIWTELPFRQYCRMFKSYWGNLQLRQVVSLGSLTHSLTHLLVCHGPQECCCSWLWRQDARTLWTVCCTWFHFHFQGSAALIEYETATFFLFMVNIQLWNIFGEGCCRLMVCVWLILLLLPYDIDKWHEISCQYFDIFIPKIIQSKKYISLRKFFRNNFLRKFFNMAVVRKYLLVGKVVPKPMIYKFEHIFILFPLGEEGLYHLLRPQSFGTTTFQVL